MCRVLLIESDDLVLSATKRMLERYGHEVVGVCHAKADNGSLSREPFDVVIADLARPGKRGLDIVADLSRRFPETQLIAMSSGAEKSALGRSETLTGYRLRHVLRKPFGLTELSDAMTGITEREAVLQP